jgi:hypothetical protein
MSKLSADDEQAPLPPAAARVVAKVRWLMLIAGATTLLAISAVIGVIGYRVSRAEKSAPAAPEMTALLPKGARIVAAIATEDRITVTLDISGTTELRIFDARTLRPAGRLRFATEP